MNSRNTNLQARLKNLEKYLDETLPPFIRSVANNSKFTRETAVRKIADTWRMHRLGKLFSQDRYATYQQMLSSQQQMDMVASSMFGKTIAKNLSPGKTPHVSNPFTDKNASYHRCDPLSNPFIDEVIESYDPDIDHENYLYIPIIRSSTTPIEEVINKHLDEKVVKQITILEKHNSPLIILRVDKNVMTSRVKSILVLTGLIASPWVISQSWSQNAISHTHMASPESETIINNAMQILPQKMNELKKWEFMQSLQSMAKNKERPTQILASCLYRMIMGLPEADKHSDITKRIAVFLKLAMTFYKNNYTQFAFMVYAITHEISLLFHRLQQEKQLEDQYDAFKKETVENAMSALGLDPDHNGNYNLLATPANGGTHAFKIALSIAEQMHGASKPLKIKSIGSIYFEIARTYRDTQADDADVYVMTAGPMVDRMGVTPGTDINKLIKSICKNGIPRKPVSILVDATSALYKTLKLNDENKQLVEAGIISIIVFESHQKFGLVHTDQAQYGRVYGVCSRASFANQTIEKTEQAARNDINAHLDAIIGSYINIQCGKDLELLKERHFANGKILNQATLGISSTHSNVIADDLSLEDRDELYFGLVYASDEKKAILAQLPYRDSFGHLNTTVDLFSAGKQPLRIANDASDAIDTSIENSQLYLGMNFKPEELIQILTDKIEARNYEDKKISDQEKVIIIAILIALKRLNYKPGTVNQRFVIAESMRHLSATCTSNITGRKAFQEISSYFNSPMIMSHDFTDLVKNKISKHITRFTKQTTTAAERKEFALALKKFSSTRSNDSAQIYIILAKLGILSLPLRKSIESEGNSKYLASRPDLCKAIVILEEFRCLNQNALNLLLKEGNSSLLLASAINNLHTAKHLNKDTLGRIINSGDKSPLDAITEILFTLDKEKRTRYIQGFSPQHQKMLYDHMSTNKHNYADIQISTAIWQECHHILLEKFCKEYKSGCWFSSFGNIFRSQLGSKVFRNEVNNLDDVIKYAVANPNGNAARTLRKLFGTDISNKQLGNQHRQGSSAPF